MQEEQSVQAVQEAVAVHLDQAERAGQGAQNGQEEVEGVGVRKERKEVPCLVVEGEDRKVPRMLLDPEAAAVAEEVQMAQMEPLDQEEGAVEVEARRGQQAKSRHRRHPLA